MHPTGMHSCSKSVWLTVKFYRKFVIYFEELDIANYAIILVRPIRLLKLFRGDVTRSPKQGFQWPHKEDLCPPKI